MTKITVTSAVTLTEEQRQRIEKTVSNKYDNYEINYIVDDMFIGGVSVFDGEKVYDGSIHGQIKRLRERLKRN